MPLFLRSSRCNEKRVGTFQGLALSQIDVRGIVKDGRAVTTDNGLQVAVVGVVE